MLTFPAEGDRGDTRLSFRSPTVNKAFFVWSACAKSFTFLCFLLLISLFKTDPKYSAEVLSRVPRPGRLWRALEKTHAFRAALCRRELVLLVVVSLLTSQQYLLNKMSLNRHRKQGYVAIS